VREKKDLSRLTVCPLPVRRLALDREWIFRDILHCGQNCTGGRTEENNNIIRENVVVNTRIYNRHCGRGSKLC
jgi:hypothetical protein